MIIGFLWGGGVTEAHACYLRVCPCPPRSTALHGLHRELTVQTDGVWGVYSVSVWQAESVRGVGGPEVWGGDHSGNEFFWVWNWSSVKTPQGAEIIPGASAALEREVRAPAPPEAFTGCRCDNVIFPEWPLISNTNDNKTWFVMGCRTVGVLTGPIPGEWLEGHLVTPPCLQ